MRLRLKTQHLASSGSVALWRSLAPSASVRLWPLRRCCQRPKQLALGAPLRAVGRWRVSPVCLRLVAGSHHHIWGGDAQKQGGLSCQVSPLGSGSLLELSFA